MIRMMVVQKRVGLLGTFFNGDGHDHDYDGVN